MLQDVHSKKISKGFTANVGDTTVVAANASAYIYIHELIGDLAADGTLEVLAGTRSLATFHLDKGQGITEQDEPGMDGVPRFECKPGEAFILRVSGGAMTGTIDYSLRY